MVFLIVQMQADNRNNHFRQSCNWHSTYCSTPKSLPNRKGMFHKQFPQFRFHPPLPFRGGCRKKSLDRACNVIIRLIQTVLYDTCFEQLIICLRYLLDTVYSDRIYPMLPQRLFQISDLLFECHVTVQQVFVDRLKMKIRAYSSWNFINCPNNHIGRSEKSTLLVAVEPK